MAAQVYSHSYQPLGAVVPLDTTLQTPFTELEGAIKDGKAFTPDSEIYHQRIAIGSLPHITRNPLAIIQAGSIQDVQAAVKYASKYNVQLTVMNGAHGWMGYCLNEDGLVLDLSNMKSVELDVDGMSISVQGGALWKDLVGLLKGDDGDKMIIGPAAECHDVGVSGFTLGGGIGPFSRSHGLGADNVLEMSVVTANGDLVTVSADSTEQNERELFWALRGGGGGNFGVTVAIKYRLHKLRNPNGKVVAGNLTWDLSTQEQEFKHMMQTLNESFQCPNYMGINALWKNDAGTKPLAQLAIVFDGGMDECQELLAPLLKYNASSTLKEMPWSDWRWDPHSDRFERNSKLYHHSSSLIFAEGAITQEVTEKIHSLMKEKTGTQIYWNHIGGATATVPKDATAFYWRDGAYVMSIAATWTNPEQKQEMYEFLEKCKCQLQPHAIEQKASYINFMDDTVSNWQEAYYGDNYPRLQQVKSTWDPTGFFHFDRAIEQAN